MFIIINLTYMPTGSRYLFFTSIYTVTKIFIASYVGIAKKKKKTGNNRNVHGGGWLNNLSIFIQWNSILTFGTKVKTDKSIQNHCWDTVHWRKMWKIKTIIQPILGLKTDLHAYSSTALLWKSMGWSLGSGTGEEGVEGGEDLSFHVECILWYCFVIFNYILTLLFQKISFKNYFKKQKKNSLQKFCVYNADCVKSRNNEAIVS